MNGNAMEAFRDEVINTINRSGLPIAEAFYVFKDCFRDFEHVYRQSLEEERKGTNDFEDSVEFGADKEEKDGN